MPDIFGRLVTIVIAFWASLAMDFYALDNPKLEQALVAVTITGGKPGAATETVAVSMSKGEHAISIERASPGKAVEMETQDISSEEFSAIWELILRHKFRSWLPEENPGDVFDFGERRLRIEWRSPASRNVLVHDVTWTRPIQHEETTRELTKAIGSLATKRLTKVKPQNIR